MHNAKCVDDAEPFIVIFKWLISEFGSKKHAQDKIGIGRSTVDRMLHKTNPILSIVCAQRIMDAYRIAKRYANA